MEWGREVEAGTELAEKRIENFVERRRRPMMLTITTSWRYDASRTREEMLVAMDRGASGRSKQPVQADGDE